MTSVPAEPHDWSTRRWGITIVCVFALHVGLVFWLQDRSPIVPRAPVMAPAFRLNNNHLGELLALEDPTLFALPHHQGFSGAAWLNVGRLTFQPADWSEPARLLPLEAQDLGACLKAFVQATVPAPFPTVSMIKPEPQIPLPFSIAPPAMASRLRIDGNLANRRLLSFPELPSWTNTDLLTNTVVQLLVDAQGYPLSLVLLGQSGYTNADGYALELTRAMRFVPVNSGPASDPGNSSPGLSLGSMIFEWQTASPGSTSPQPTAP